MKEERFPHTRKPLPGRRLWVVEGGASEPRRRVQQQGGGGRSREIPDGGSEPISTHQPERLVGSPAGAGEAWELRLGFQLDRRERTGVGGVNTA